MEKITEFDFENELIEPTSPNMHANCTDLTEDTPESLEKLYYIERRRSNFEVIKNVESRTTVDSDILAYIIKAGGYRHYVLKEHAILDWFYSVEVILKTDKIEKPKFLFVLVDYNFSSYDAPALVFDPENLSRKELDHIWGSLRNIDELEAMPVSINKFEEDEQKQLLDRAVRRTPELESLASVLVPHYFMRREASFVR